MFILLSCWNDGDGNLVEDSFVACSESKNKLIEKSKSLGGTVYEDGCVPDDLNYRDSRVRHRIIKVDPL